MSKLTPTRTCIRPAVRVQPRLPYSSTLVSGRSASDLECAVRRRFVTRSVTQGIPTLEREER
ncbi:hypothetical protein ALP23_04795 [Pseudomonas syringae pv. apii]|uniref:Uncharacterized protein n=1 Tax=Pseudomonas syringae pv. apii TaxID=81036 RepID=A0A3M5WMJ0_9PSED|nr:hypothetical protein ALP23_04795 [Pseudomonas syringae pv. apii]